MKNKEYKDFMFDKNNSYNCENCPENIHCDDWQDRLPCGQWNCWVVLNNKGEE